MGKYVKAVSITTNVGGDEVTVTMKPIKFKDLLHLQAAAQDGEAAMIGRFIEMLPKYVQTISGAVDGDGNAITVDDLEDAYWAGMVGEMCVALVSAATPSDPT